MRFEFLASVIEFIESISDIFNQSKSFFFFAVSVFERIQWWHLWYLLLALGLGSDNEIER